MTDEILSTSPATSPQALPPAAKSPIDEAAAAVPPHLQWLKVESLDREGGGVANRGDGRVVFIEEALPGEGVRVSAPRRKNNWEQATMAERRSESSQRVTPRCTYFGLC